MKKHLPGGVVDFQKTKLPCKYTVIYKHTTYVLTRAQAFFNKARKWKLCLTINDAGLCTLRRIYWAFFCLVERLYLFILKVHKKSRISSRFYNSYIYFVHHRPDFFITLFLSSDSSFPTMDYPCLKRDYNRKHIMLLI